MRLRTKWRRFSDHGGPRAAASPVQARHDVVGRPAPAGIGRAGAVDPRRAQPGPRGPVEVPGVDGDHQQVARRHPAHLRHVAVRAGGGLPDARVLHRQHVLELPAQTGVAEQLLRDRRRPVAHRHQPQAARPQRAHAVRHVGVAGKRGEPVEDVRDGGVHRPVQLDPVQHRRAARSRRARRTAPTPPRPSARTRPAAGPRTTAGRARAAPRRRRTGSRAAPCRTGSRSRRTRRPEQACQNHPGSVSTVVASRRASRSNFGPVCGSSKR